jgi:hypothetical protein
MLRHNLFLRNLVLDYPACIKALTEHDKVNALFTLQCFKVVYNLNGNLISTLQVYHQVERIIKKMSLDKIETQISNAIHYGHRALSMPTSWLPPKPPSTTGRPS